MYSIVFCECLLIFPPDTQGIPELLAGLEKPKGPSLLRLSENQRVIRMNERIEAEMCENSTRMCRIRVFDNCEANNLLLSSMLVYYIYMNYEKIEKLEPTVMLFTFQYGYEGQFNLEFDPYMLRQIALMTAQIRVLATKLESA